MSLTRLIQVREVAERFDEVWPPLIRNAHVQPLVPSRNPKRGALLGTAFDYALRFELKRAYPHARERRWIAEKTAAAMAANQELLPAFLQTAASTAARIVADAKRFHARYIDRARVTPSVRRQLAQHALRLAALDPYYRAGYRVEAPEQVEAVDVEELCELLRIAPIDAFQGRPLLLNPSFGLLSAAVEGADADLIAGEALVDVKTTADTRLEPKHLRQLLGYLLLARGARAAGARLPPVRRLSVYFSRAALFWTIDVAALEAATAFRSLERWFLKRIRCPERLIQKRHRGVGQLGLSATTAATAAWRVHRAGNAELVATGSRYEWVDLSANRSCRHQHMVAHDAVRCAQTFLNRRRGMDDTLPPSNRCWERPWGKPYFGLAICRTHEAGSEYLGAIVTRPSHCALLVAYLSMPDRFALPWVPRSELAAVVRMGHPERRARRGVTTVLPPEIAALLRS